MASFNLVHNSRVFFTTNVDAATGIAAATSYTTANSQEIQILDGFSFSQATNADTIQVSEAGSTPVRGQRTFNTSLNNVEFSFSTYLRPYLDTGVVKAEEAVLWNALLSDTAIDATPVTLGGTVSGAVYSTTTGAITISGTTMTYPGVTVGEIYTMTGFTGSGASGANVPVQVTSLDPATIVLQVLSPGATALTLATGGTIKFNKCAWTSNAAVATDAELGNFAYAQATTAVSNKNQLQKFAMIMKIDGITYVIDNCAMDQASVDFSLDGIATVAWTGKGTAIRELDVTWGALTGNPTMTGDLAGTNKGKVNGNYITNKLSTVALAAQIGGGGQAYTLALTGGNITIANNITYVIPANLGRVNTAIGYFTGTRAVSGNITAYLRTGSTNTAGLLDQMLLDSATEVEPKFQLKVAIGGSSNTTRVETAIYGATLQIPTVDAQAVMSTTINFNAQGTDPLIVAGSSSAFDLASTNDLRIRYFSNTAAT